jgi:transposase, IS30 family
MAHHHFTSSERSEISILKKKKYTNRAIAQELGCSHTSIGRELKRNTMKKGYDARSAKLKARVRRKQSKYQGMRIQDRPELKTYVITYLEKHWTPEEISGRLKEVDTHLPYVSAKGIYKWLYSAWGQRYCPLLPKQRYKPKPRRGKKTKREMIPNRTGIEERPEEANSRSEFGHYETDTMVSGKKTGSKAALTLLHGRKARFTRLKKIPNLKPSTNAKALTKMGKTVIRRTITHDNGIENKNHEDVAKALSVKTFFCDPYSSWQKGSVENTIGRIRRFIPKGADISLYSDREIAAVEHWLNHTPRKCLGYKTPYEVMLENNLLLSSTYPDS